MTKPLTTKQAVSWLNAHTNRKVACTTCDARYSWRSIYFLRRHHEACEHPGEAAWTTTQEIQ